LQEHESASQADASILGVQLARFSAGLAIVLAVFAQPDAIQRLAEAAIPIATATFFREFANAADKILSHARRLPLFSRNCKITGGLLTLRFALH
jgi:hypothetical protein